eukprot:CAMPEP_0175073836 /NCGR_PEP_ID=MMETSP0052_2-20121109/20850_1 /TAXON_ID=51329 ORGANISM="Polytomella parva, Strain SAG 63-3" /NCGR_SAMPLE_ID=MMETSP0052_2 /ASSEMBLY_ACC=CAM_ASM_000194 /LENGTH=68 /DNA_ID=CAMNT_0016341823 /DNA_START=14 /DNA_END=217 /DNA_ORIENTATION=-
MSELDQQMLAMMMATMMDKSNQGRGISKGPSSNKGNLKDNGISMATQSILDAMMGTGVVAGTVQPGLG